MFPPVPSRRPNCRSRSPPRFRRSPSRRHRSGRDVRYSGGRTDVSRFVRDGLSRLPGRLQPDRHGLAVRLRHLRRQLRPPDIRPCRRRRGELRPHSDSLVRLHGGDLRKLQHLGSPLPGVASLDRAQSWRPVASRHHHVRDLFGKFRDRGGLRDRRRPDGNSCDDAGRIQERPDLGNDMRRWFARYHHSAVRHCRRLRHGRGLADGRPDRRHYDSRAREHRVVHDLHLRPVPAASAGWTAGAR